MIVAVSLIYSVRSFKILPYTSFHLEAVPQSPWTVLCHTATSKGTEGILNSLYDMDNFRYNL